ncbi:MAG: M48 family metallopeptidase [Burkholderiales bacterium]|nr:M48 family metallopeptidase [Burkholderiales bacterium]
MRSVAALLSTVLAALATGPGVPAAAQASADPGIEVRKPRLMLVPESTVNDAAAQQYGELKRQAQAKRVLNVDAPQVRRVRDITARLIAHGGRFNASARNWAWEVNVIDTPAINAFCMPGGKIVVFDGLIDRLQLTDDEIAAVIGHEIAHALLEHGRARMSQEIVKSVGLNFAAAYFGLSGVGTAALAQAAQLAITLPYGRSQETDADLVGLELSARAGYDPRAAITLWRKMAATSLNQPPQFLSTHPGHANRVRKIEQIMPRVLPLYEAAR